MFIYVAGPMRGKPDFNFPAFEAATKYLRKLGHEVFNPAERDLTAGFKSVGMTGHEDLSEEGFDLRAALAADLAYITLEADALCVLPGWENSAGARAEVATAHALGLLVVREGGFLSSRPWRMHEYQYLTSHLVKPDLAPSGKIANVSDLTTKRKSMNYSPDLSQDSRTFNINPSDTSNTYVAPGTHTAAYLLRRKRVMEGRTFHEADPDAQWPTDPANEFPPVDRLSNAEWRRKLAEPEHPEVKAVREALDGEVRSVSSTGAEKGVKLAMFHLFPSKEICGKPV